MPEMNAPRRNYSAEIAELARGGLAPAVLKDRMDDYHDNDIAEALGLLTPQERNKLYGIFEADELADIFEHLDDITGYIGELGVRKRINVLSCLETSSVVDYLKTLERPERNDIIDLMQDDDKREIALFGSFDDEEIGSRMSNNMIRVKSGSTVPEVMRELISQAADNDNISTIYVVDAKGIYTGAIDLKDLIIARQDTDLYDITTSSYPYVYANESIDDCIDILKDYSEDSIPVLDPENRLIGALTAQDVTALVDEEMGEDYAKLAGLASEEDLREPVLMSISKRLPWLIILLLLGMVVSSVVGLFEHVVESLTLVVCFQSLVLDMAGNAGTQSLAVTIRVLMDEKLTAKDKLHLIAKESKVGTCNGIFLGVLSCAAVGPYLMIAKGQSAGVAFTVAGCIGLALLISMFLSAVAGTAIPIAFRKIGIDPAVASGPLITTVNDLVAVIAYYGLVWVLLINIMGM